MPETTEKSPLEMLKERVDKQKASKRASHNSVASKSSPRTRLREKFKKSKDVKPIQPVNPIQLFATWLARQMVRTWGTVCHNKHPFMLLFNFDMSKDPLSTDLSSMVGSRLDILLIKVNGGIYYESSTHMAGIQKRMSRELHISPPQLLYVHNPSTHVKNATVDLGTDISKLQYVATSIPASLVREHQDWDPPLDVLKHLPTIKPVNALPPNE